MEITDFYKTDDYGELFKYFFEIYVVAFTKGVATNDFELVRSKLPHIGIDSKGEVENFLREGTSFLREGYTPKLLSLFLDRLCVECVNIDTLKEQKHMINMSRALIESLHQFDIEPLLLSLSVLWSNDVREYAETNFYPRLPSDIQQKYLN